MSDLIAQCQRSVAARGFLDTVQHERFEHAEHMATILHICAELGRYMRALRKGTADELAVSANTLATILFRLRDGAYTLDRTESDMVGDPLIMQQVARMVEEVGEFAEALMGGDGHGEELADVFVTVASVAAVTSVDLAGEVPQKLDADEKRGVLHGEVVA